MHYSIQYNPALAQQHVNTRLLPFALFGVTGGYGPTRSALVNAVRAGNHAVARTMFTKLVLEGISDDARENGVSVQHAHNALVEVCKSDPLYVGFLVESI